MWAHRSYHVNFRPFTSGLVSRLSLVLAMGSGSEIASPRTKYIMSVTLTLTLILSFARKEITLRRSFYLSYILSTCG